MKAGYKKNRSFGGDFRKSSGGFGGRRPSFGKRFGDGGFGGRDQDGGGFKRRFRDESGGDSGGESGGEFKSEFSREDGGYRRGFSDRGPRSDFSRDDSRSFPKKDWGDKKFGDKKKEKGADEQQKPKQKILIVGSEFYPEILELQLAGAKKIFEAENIEYEIVRVPGSSEIPSAISFAAKRFIGYLALGCVIKGETEHYEVVAKESAAGLIQLSIRNNLAIGNGIIVANSMEEAVERADSEKKNRAGDAALVCVKMLKVKNLLQK